MNFDWPTFLRRSKIEYVEASTEEIVIRCPWCGVNDPSHHLSINLQGKGYRCFRNPEDHKGKNPPKLIQALLGCSWERAYELCGQSFPVVDNFKEQLEALLAVNRHVFTETIKYPRMPKEFLPITNKPSVWPYLSHMRGRGYSLHETLKLAKKYDLRYCEEGPFRGRIIFPIKRHGELLNWTGRALRGVDGPRYRSHTRQPELAAKLGMGPAAEAITNLLLWHDELESTNAHTLVICEGPFDVLRINYFGAIHGIIATCLFTMLASDAQVQSLRELLPKFKRAVSLLDQGTFNQEVILFMKLPAIQVLELPKNVKDPGKLQEEDFAKLFLTS